MWSVARTVLRFPPMFYFLFGTVLVCKWFGWFPIMVVRHGLKDALDAALISPGDAARRSKAGAGTGLDPIGTSQATPP
jgi:hypothetical protein